MAVGVCDGLKPDDLVFATYRSHGFYIAKGGSLDAMFAELYGRKGGVSGGKAGSCTSRPLRSASWDRRRCREHHPARRGCGAELQAPRAFQIAVAVFGDGATEEGVYHESLYELRGAHEGAGVVPVRGQRACRAQPSAGAPVLSSARARQDVRHRQPAAREGWDVLAIRQATLEAAAR